MNQQPKLLDQLRNAIRLKHYPLSTETAYVSWAKRYILFHNKRHPNEMGARHIQAFLTHLAVEKHVTTTFMINRWATRSKRPPNYQAFKSTSPLMYSVTALQPIYWRREQISEPCKNFWATRALRRPRSTCTA